MYKLWHPLLRNQTIDLPQRSRGVIQISTIKLGGYFFDLSVARILNRSLNTKDDEVPDTRLERPINNRLVDNGRRDILAAWIMLPKDHRPGSPGVTHPDAKPGMMICTQLWPVKEENPGPDIPEQEKDLKVKEWLIDNGVSELRWVCVLDLDEITRYSCFPRKMPVKPPVGDDEYLWEALGVSEEFWEATRKAIGEMRRN